MSVSGHTEGNPNPFKQGSYNIFQNSKQLDKCSFWKGFLSALWLSLQKEVFSLGLYSHLASDYQGWVVHSSNNRYFIQTHIKVAQV